MFGETEPIDGKDKAANHSDQTTQACQKSVDSQSLTGASSSETSSPGYIFQQEVMKGKQIKSQAVQGTDVPKRHLCTCKLHLVLLQTIHIALTIASVVPVTRNMRYYSEWLYAS